MLVFVITRSVIVIFRWGKELGLSSTHSLEYPFGAMSVGILQWLAEIGIFNTKVVKYPFRSKCRINVCSRNLNRFYTICCMFLLLLICAGDIELNPGPRKNNPSYNFPFCRRNLTVLRHITFQNYPYWNLIT